MRTGSAFVRHASPVRTSSAAIVAVIISVAVSVAVVRVLVLIAVASLLAGVSRLIVARRTRLRVVAIRRTRRTRIARGVRRAFVRHSSPIWTASSPIVVVVAVVPIMGILILPILIMTIVRVLLPMIVVVTLARMWEVASTIGYRIASAIVVSVATVVCIVAVSVAVIRSVVIAMLRIRRVAIGAMIVIVPWTTVVAAARLKWLVPRRRRHLDDYRALIDPLGNSCTFARMHAENAFV
jgi:hypothetical protein